TARVDVHVATDDPAQQSQLLMKRCDAGLEDGIVWSCGQQHAYAAHPLRLLRAHRERPRCRAAEQRDELAPPHGLPPKARDRGLSIAGHAVHRSKAVPSMSASLIGRLGSSAFRLSTNCSV